MSFLSSIKSWANENLGTNFEDHTSEAEVLRGLEAVNENLSKLPTLTESIENLTRDFQEIKTQFGELSSKFGEIKPVNVEEIQSAVTAAVTASVQSNLDTQLEAVNGRIDDIAGKAALVAAGKPIQGNTTEAASATPPAAVKQFANALNGIKLTK